MATGDGDVPSWSRKKARGQRRRRQAALLPVDIMAEIAARTDPVTLVRCAATCSDVRGRVADPAFRQSLRLRHADRRRFVPSLLRGHLIGDSAYRVKTAAGGNDDERIYLVDPAATTGATAGLLRDSETFPPGPGGEPLRLHTPLSARDGLVLVGGAHELRVCNLATGRSQTFPHGPGFTGRPGTHHVLLVGVGEGGGAVGRPFQVVKARLVLEKYLQVQTFSSELGMWGPCTEIRTPQIHGHADCPLKGRPLVAGGAVHWLCLTSRAGYVLKLRVRAAAPAAPQLTVTELPESYPHNVGKVKHLLATMTAGGRPAVLAADTEKISAWTQTKDGTRWHRQPQVIIEYEAIARFVASVSGERLQLQLQEQQVCPPLQVNLDWFAERSGIVLIRMHDRYFFWLNLQSKEIVAWTSDPRIRCKTIYCPCEMDLSTWVPTFNSSLIA